MRAQEVVSAVTAFTSMKYERKDQKTPFLAYLVGGFHLLRKSKEFSTEVIPVTNAAQSVVHQDQTAGESVTNAARSVPDQGRSAGGCLANDVRSVTDRRETAGKGVPNNARNVPEKGGTTGQSAAPPKQDNSVCTEHVIEHSFVFIMAKTR